MSQLSPGEINFERRSGGLLSTGIQYCINSAYRRKGKLFSPSPFTMAPTACVPTSDYPILKIFYWCLLRIFQPFVQRDTPYFAWIIEALYIYLFQVVDLLPILLYDLAFYCPVILFDVTQL